MDNSGRRARRCRMEGRQRRSTDDYKRQEVDLVASSGRSIGSVARELGLRDSVLRRWVEQRVARLVSNAIRNCPLCVMKNCPHPRVHDVG
ncbi:transposase [Bradyrhizobium sp. UFLA05-153]